MGAGRVIVVGSVNVDLVVRVDQLPRPGETVTASGVSRHHGGKSANQAVAAARVGARVVFVGAVGDDDFGHEARAALAADGIDVSELVERSGLPTGVAYILVDASGENVIVIVPGANAAVSESQVRRSLQRLAVHAGDVVLVSNEVPPAAVTEALRYGSTAGATTVLNPAPAAELPREGLEWAQVVTPNAGELAMLAGQNDTLARQAWAVAGGPRDGRSILVSRGADGAVLFTDGKEHVIQAPHVDAVDTVGAGDTLSGVLAAELTLGYSLADAANRAVVAASLATTRPGARDGMPTRRDLARALRGLDVARRSA